MDLHQVTELGKNSWYLHIIDLFWKFSVATLIKQQEVIYNCERVSCYVGLHFWSTECGSDRERWEN